MDQRSVTTRPLPQDPDELFDVIDEDGHPTGIVKRRADVHRDGDWHRAVHVWIIGADDGEPFILFQRRSSGKDTWPDMLDVTVGGHLRAGESVTGALREVEEELGITPDLTTLRHIGTYIVAGILRPDHIDRERLEIFLLRDNRPLAAYNPAMAEVAALARFPLDPLLTLFAGARDRVPATLLDVSTRTITKVELPRAAFIPDADDYFRRVVLAARAAICGDHHVAT